MLRAGEPLVYKCIGFNTNESRSVNYSLDQETYFKNCKDMSFPFTIKKIVINQLELVPNTSGELKRKYIGNGKPKSCEIYYESKLSVNTLNISVASGDFIIP